MLFSRDPSSQVKISSISEQKINPQQFGLITGGFVVIGLILLASIGSLSIVFYLQYGEGLHPCTLCIWQRWPYAVLILIGSTGLFYIHYGQTRHDQNHNGKNLTVLLGLLALISLIGAGLALFHVGVEQRWWQGLATCSGNMGASTLEALRAQIMAAPITRCDEVLWSLFGLSLAGYNLLLSLVLTFLALYTGFSLSIGAWEPIEITSIGRDNNN